MKNIVYVGTYTNGSSGGIHTLSMDTATGALEQIQPVIDIQRPSWLAASTDSRFLYSVMETDAFEDGQKGGVTAFAIDSNDGKLTVLNAMPTGVRGPCHISLDGGNRRLFASNYHEGFVSVFPLNACGSIGQRLAVMQHQGSGPVKGRQDGPHAHFAVLTPGGERLCAVDLGADSVFVYRFDSISGMPLPDESNTIRMKPGSGPRHMVFHPNGRFAYIVTELSNDLAVYGYNPSTGEFAFLEAVSALPDGFSGTNYCASVRLSPNGSVLYASNRGHDSIVVFSVDAITGRLSHMQHMSTLGQWPRDFAIDPAGRFLLAANQHTDTVVTFSIEPGSGKLEPTGQAAAVPQPTCVRFVQQQQK